MFRSFAAPWISLATLALSPNVFALNTEIGAEDRNYRVIIDRNPFGLKPAPPPVTNAPVVATIKDEILLTGITSIGGLRAYFMSKAPQGKPPEYYSLGVDEKKNGLEVIQIDTSARSVKVRNAGVESVMTFASNGVKPPAGPATPAPGAPGTAPAGAPPALPGGGGPPGGSPPVAQVNAGAPGTSTATLNPAGGRMRTIPSRNVRTPTVNVNAGFEPNQGAARPDPNAAVQDVLLMELQKRANPNVTFPPTPGLPE